MSETVDLESQPSCDPALSRSQFLALLVKKAVLAGTLLAAPVIADAFMAPPAQAAPSGATGTSDTGTQDKVTDKEQDLE